MKLICKQLVKVKISIPDLELAVWQKLLNSTWKLVRFINFSLAIYHFHPYSASKMWQHEIQDFNLAGCVDSNCNEAANCNGGADGIAPFGCGHFTQQIWAVSIL